MSLPGNQRKLDAADALAQLAEEAGMTLIEMALAFVLNHPAVTAPIIGPRTMEQLESQLPAADVTLSAEVLDRIDEVVPPGTNLNPADGGWQNPALAAGGRDAAGSDRQAHVCSKSGFSRNLTSERTFILCLLLDGGLSGVRREQECGHARADTSRSSYTSCSTRTSTPCGWRATWTPIRLGRRIWTI